MKPGRVTLTLLSVGLFLQAEPAHAGDWPLWPTQIEQSTRALEPGSDASESSRIAELRQLEEAPDAIAVAYILRALEDESTEMRRIAMRACVERRIEACLPAAEIMWMESSDPAIRLRSLQLLALFPNEERLETLLEALDGDEPSMRDQASESLASAPLPPEQEKRLRTVLQAKLDDQSATVRRRAAITLGMRGPGGGTVSLIRHLDDPDPAVRTASAEALGRLGDVRALPALRRALEGTPDRALANQIVATLGLLPGDEVDTLLLALFDEPPFKRRNQVVSAIGTREAPADALVDGLITRLRDGDLHDSALKALRWMGPSARPRIQAALDRGLEASLAAELLSLLDALDVDAAQTGPQTPVAPVRTDPSALALDAGRARAATPDAHTGAWVVGQAMHADEPVTAREALFTLALWDEPQLPSHDLAVLQTRLARWIADSTLDADDRCLSAAALARSALAGRRQSVLRDLELLVEEPGADTRACVVMAASGLGDFHLAESGLADPDARVRASAALGLRGTDPSDWPDTLRQRLQAVARHDLNDAARACAAFALALPPPKKADDRSGGPAPAGLWTYAIAPSSAAWTDPEARVWARFDQDALPRLAPVHGHGSLRWLIGAGLGTTAAYARSLQPPVVENPDGFVF